MTIHDRIDKLGAIGSFLCGIHCAITPCILVMFPILSASFLANEFWEHCFLLISGILAFGSVCFGYKVHKRLYIFGILSLGFFLVVVGHMYHEHLIGLTTLVLGGFTVSFSHIVNYRLCKSCSHCN